jgi:hypothetical protein
MDYRNMGNLVFLGVPMYSRFPPFRLGPTKQRMIRRLDSSRSINIGLVRKKIRLSKARSIPDHISSDMGRGFFGISR